MKPAALTAALGATGAAAHVAWMYWRKEASVTVLQVTWSPDRSSHIGAMPQGGAALELWVSPVARPQVNLMRTLVREDVLPQARAWLEDALAAGDAWKASRHERTWQLVNGRLEHHDRDGVETLRHVN